MKKQTTPQLTITNTHTVENERKNKWAPPKRSKLTVYVNGYQGAVADVWDRMPRREQFETAPSAMGIKFFDEAGYKAASEAWDKECNAAHRAWVKDVTPLVQRAIAEKYMFVSGVKIHWSRTAGCRCGCSPGFKADLTTTEHMWVTIHSPESLAAQQAKDAANSMLKADKDAEAAEVAEAAQMASFDACI
jgi:hypothetical protein